MNLPGAGSVIRLARVSSSSAARTAVTEQPVRLAAADTEMSGPGWTPSRRNKRATSGRRARYDHENTARTSVVLSPTSRASSR